MYNQGQRVLWANVDHDVPVEIVGYAGLIDGRHYWYIKDLGGPTGVTGIPEDEIRRIPSEEEMCLCTRDRVAPGDVICSWCRLEYEDQWG